MLLLITLISLGTHLLPSRGQQIFPWSQNGFPFGFGTFLPILSDRGSDLRTSAQLIKNTIGGFLVNNEQVLGPPCSSRDGVLGDCRPLIKCVRFLFEVETLRALPCQLPFGQPGVCCPHSLVVSTSSNKSNILSPPPAPEVEIPPIKPEDISAAADAAINTIREQTKLEDTLFQQGVVVKKGTAAFGSQRFHSTNRFASEDGRKALTALAASAQLSASFNLSLAQSTFALPRFSLKGSKIAETCPAAAAACPPNARYRMIDGSCNNQQRTAWGKSNIALQRLLPPRYGDGLGSPRLASNGGQLPSARAVSTAVTSSQDKPDNKYTLILMQWGQFLDHDITHTPVVKGTAESGIKCCADDGSILSAASAQRHPECFPIELPTNDRLYGRFGQRCMEFVRSIPAPRTDCNFGPREQVNQVTAWIDGSNVYASDTTEAKKLRLGKGGRLRVTRVQGRDLLPLNPSECGNTTLHRYCFSAGDLRCNEQLQLTLMHTLWMREHNRLADKLATLNPNWNDETLYQEARRLVIAQMQHITYNEWLPIVLGPAYMAQWGLAPRDSDPGASSGHTTNYDPGLNPSVSNVFATAAFRFGHTLVANSLESFGRGGRTHAAPLPITKTQFAPYAMYDNGTVESYVRGLTTQPSQAFDTAFAPELTGHLFQEEGESFGMDLVALNIQRGRDHGLAPYMAWRQLCGLPTADSWKGLAMLFNSMVVARLQALYANVEDIDVFVGGILEESAEGALLGPTFLCIIGDQFTRLKTGDRFWYEEAAAGLTKDQLTEIKQSSLARVLCDNSDGLDEIQPLVFHAVSENNRRFPCDSESIPQINLTKWSS